VQLTASETSGEEVTVSGTAVEVTPPSEAVMLVLPGLKPVAEPVELMVATLAREDAQVATKVTFCGDPLVKVAMAMYCTFAEGEMVALAGVTVIDSGVALVTWSVVEPVANGPPGLVKAALMEVDPWVRAVARPKYPGVLATVATAVLLDCQLATVVMFWLLPSLNIPVATKRSVVSGAMLGFTGETAMD